MNRRQILLGTAGAGATLAVGAIPSAVAGKARSAPTGTDAGALPMPVPSRILPGPVPEQDRSRTRMERGWLFHEGDVVAPTPDGHNATYLSVKAGNALGAAAMAYDDSDWAPVRLP